jgi:hypothetical protein
MTENHKPGHIDLFFRQALLVEGRVPVVWGAGQKFDLLQMLHNEADADIGEFGTGWDGVPETMDEKQASSLPYAVQNLKCKERLDLCQKPYKFCAICWLKRQDRIKPLQKQYDKPHGQTRWHPGWRTHQLTGRVLAFAVLQALQDAIDVIGSGNDQQLQEALNMTGYYDNIRRKVQNLDPSFGNCYAISQNLPERVCRTSMKGRTQYTPRYDAEHTSITSIIKPAPDGHVPRNYLRPLYEGPDAYNPCFELPTGAVDVVGRIEKLENATITTRHLSGGAMVTESDKLGREIMGPISTLTAFKVGSARIRKKVEAAKPVTLSPVATNTTIVPGLGWQLKDEPQGICDGSYDAVCAKSTFNRCVLYGHHDERGAVLGSELSGWLVLQIPRKEVQEGIIILKLHTWYHSSDNSRTRDWQTVNNETSGELFNQTSADDGLHERQLLHSLPARDLTEQEFKTPRLGEWFQFEYAIDGRVTTLSRDEFLSRKKDIQRLVEVITLLDDESFAAKETGSSSILEVAIRMKGCGRKCVFGVSHLYWA